MEDNFDINISEESQEKSMGGVQLPMNFLTIGEVETDDVKVYIKQNVYKALEKYALEDVDNERGTIILGDFCEEHGKLHVVISDYIEAKYTDASASTLTFTHETWNYIHKVHEKKYPDKKIVGWQHTHPSYGIFLSNYDLFIHENYFDLPFQVAYVIDPIQNLRGFFQWKKGKIEKLRGFYIYDDVGKPIKIEPPQKKDNDTVQEAPRARTSWISKTAITLALLIAVASLVYCVVLTGMLNSQKQIIEEQNSKQEQYEQQLGDESLADTVKKQKTTIDDQQKKIDELSASVNALKKQNGDGEYIKYTVKSGDSLDAICAQLGIDYQANKDKIMEINGISDENIIFIGQTLKFPSSLVND